MSSQTHGKIPMGKLHQMKVVVQRQLAAKLKNKKTKKYYSPQKCKTEIETY